MNNRSKKIFVRIFVLALAAVFSLSGDVNAQTAEDKTLSPYFFVKGDPSIDRLPLKRTDVDIAVSGVIADVKVTQTYQNAGTRPINASYVFPASTRAAVYGMQMRIGNQIIKAKIKERQEARDDFERAKKEGKSASLLEEERPNVFTMSVANIMPGEEIEVELKYTEFLVPTKGVYELVYPTVVGPRYPSKKAPGSERNDKWVKAGYLREGEDPPSLLNISARVRAGLPIRKLESPSHRINPEWTGQTSAALTLDGSEARGGNRDFILRYALAGDAIQSGLLLFEGEEENFFLYMAQPPERVAPSAIPPREYIFVVDVSGSMEGFPLETSQRLLRDLIGRLRPTDYFNVVLFAGDSALLSSRSLPANEANIAKAIRLIDEQRGAGGTELLEAMKTAMSIPDTRGTSRSLVLVSDGYISAEEEVFSLIKNNLNRGNVFAFGIGSSVNRYLIEGVARAGYGEPFVLTDPAESTSVARAFREYIETPVLTDISVRINGLEAYDVFPEKMPDLFAERPIVLFGKWKGPLTGWIEISGRSGSGSFSESFDVAQAESDPSNSALRYLWARTKISDLSDFGLDQYSFSDRNKEEITALGIKYNLLTRFTSFIAVREVVTNPDGSATNVEQPLPLPEGVSEFAIGSEPELSWLLALLALSIAAAALIRHRSRVGGLLAEMFRTGRAV